MRFRKFETYMVLTLQAALIIMILKSNTAITKVLFKTWFKKSQTTKLKHKK